MRIPYAYKIDGSRFRLGVFWKYELCRLSKSDNQVTKHFSVKAANKVMEFGNGKMGLL